MADRSLRGAFHGFFRALLTILGGVAGFQLAQFFLREHWPTAISLVHPILLTFVFIVFFSLVGFVSTPLFMWGLGFLGQIFETRLQTFGISDIIVAFLGLIIGLLIANLIAFPISSIPVVGVYIAVLLNVTLGYVGVRFFVRRREEIWAILTNFGGLKQRLANAAKKKNSKNGTDLEEPPEMSIEEGWESGAVFPEKASVKILDTSVLIDGRILDVAATGFLEGRLLLPRFILTELQAVADSTDPVRRARGRRGLDVVNDLQKMSHFSLEIYECTLKDLGTEYVDEALVKLGKKLGARVLTTDYNLNKIAQIEGVFVLNVNDLANALKPMLLPGETVEVDVIREGKESHQGVGYLDDGTMLVVEDGERYIGKRVEVVVTSMLQTSAGRLIFGRLKKETKA